MEKKSKVLIVDDELINLNIMENDLQDAGFEVLRAEDGIIALTILRGNPNVDVIVLDRMMPNMDGMEVVRVLKNDPVFKHVPIIMQTAAGQEQQIKEGMAAGVFFYLIKPYSDTQLLGTVRSALHRRKIFSGMVKEITTV